MKRNTRLKALIPILTLIILISNTMFSPIFINAKGGDPEKSETNKGSGISDDAGDDGGQGEDYDPGDQGEDDDPGDTGGVGDSGDTGGSGDAGDTGDSGDTGGSGDAGDTGDSGDTGGSGDTFDYTESEIHDFIEEFEDLMVDIEEQGESESGVISPSPEVFPLINIFYPNFQINLLYLLILLLTTYGGYKVLQRYSSEENEII
jgi:hypothetical protein